MIERDLTEPDRIVGELLQPGGYLKLQELDLAGNTAAPPRTESSPSAKVKILVSKSTRSAPNKTVTCSAWNRLRRHDRCSEGARICSVQRREAHTAGLSARESPLRRRRQRLPQRPIHPENEGEGCNPPKVTSSPSKEIRYMCLLKEIITGAPFFRRPVLRPNSSISLSA